MATPLKAIRSFCRECVGMELSEIEKCSCGPEGKGYYCPLWPFRFGHVPAGAGSRLKAIVLRCRQCVGVDLATLWKKEIEACSGGHKFGTPEKCPLWTFRLGHTGRKDQTNGP